MTSRKDSLSGLLDPRLLRRLAGARAFERGEAYFAGGQVGAVIEHEGTIAAKVQGTRTYRVKLWRDGDEFDYACTCPVGDDGAFCKHGVAVGLAWLEAGSAKTSPSKVSAGKAKPPRVTLDDVRAQLLTRDKRALVELLMQQAIEDDGLRRRLLMEAAGRDPKRLDLVTYRQAIDEAVDVGGFVDYREAYDYARGIDAAIDGIEKLLKQDHAAEAIELAEHALAAVEEAMGSVDDSDGEMGGILERLQALHHRACKKAKPDPEALARRLFAWELRTDWDTFYGAAQTYADVFGKKGLATYRALAEAEWAQVKPLRPGRDDPEKYGKRFRITKIMETMAEQTGDVEALVAGDRRALQKIAQARAGAGMGRARAQGFPHAYRLTAARVPGPGLSPRQAPRRGHGAGLGRIHRNIESAKLRTPAGACRPGRSADHLARPGARAPAADHRQGQGKPSQGPLGLASGRPLDLGPDLSLGEGSGRGLGRGPGRWLLERPMDGARRQA